MLIGKNTMADNRSETTLRPLFLQRQGRVAKFSQTSTLSLWPSNTLTEVTIIVVIIIGEGL